MGLLCCSSRALLCVTGPSLAATIAALRGEPANVAIEGRMLRGGRSPLLPPKMRENLSLEGVSTELHSAVRKEVKIIF